MPCCAVLQGIKPDRQREVLQYYQYSADRGNVDAQTAVGTLLNIGTHGVVRDHTAAAHYLQRAAASGSAEAMAHLGHMYGSGMGVAPVSVERERPEKWWVSRQQWWQVDA